MSGGSKDSMIKDSNVAQISAAIYYQANVIAKLTSSKQFKDKFKATIFSQILKDFGNYVDSQARMKPKSLHHMYEWKKTGDPEARLFNLRLIDGEGISFKIAYEYKLSQSFVPAPEGRRKHVFANKASVMESGMPLKIAPRHSERLVFDSNGETVFMPKGASVVVQRPGGASVKNQFTLRHSIFFKSQLVNQSIKASGFQKIFNSALTKAMRLPAPIKKVQYSFSPNTIRSMADSAVTQSFGGAMV
jgi:hypothetical protein